MSSLITLSLTQETAYDYSNAYFGPYLHVYPPTDIGQDPGTCTPIVGKPCPLFIAVMFSFGGSFTSSGAIPSLQLAVDQMNNNPNFLPGYRLHLLVQDSQVKFVCPVESNHTILPGGMLISLQNLKHVV